MGSIPEFNNEGVWAPYKGKNAGVRHGRSPYNISNINEIKSLLARNPKRESLFNNFILYRDTLRNADLFEGMVRVWLDGSFCSTKEEPQDLDIVILGNVKGDLSPQKSDLLEQLFDRDLMKEQYKCDPWLLDLSLPPIEIVDETIFLYGLFAHKTNGGIWKGFCELSLELRTGESSYLDHLKETK